MKKEIKIRLGREFWQAMLKEQATRVKTGDRQGFRERISATEPLVAKTWLLDLLRW